MSTPNLFLYLSFFVQSSLDVPNLDVFQSNQWIDYDHSLSDANPLSLHQDPPNGELPTPVDFLHLRIKMPDGSFVTLFSCLQPLLQQDRRDDFPASTVQRLRSCFPSSLSEETAEKAEENAAQKNAVKASTQNALLEMEKNLDSFLANLSESESDSSSQSESECRFKCLFCHTDTVDDTDHIPGCFCEVYQDCGDCRNRECVMR